MRGFYFSRIWMELRTSVLTFIRRSSRLRQLPANIEGTHRPVKSLERKLARRLRARRRLDGQVDLRVDQDLAVLGVCAQPRRKVDHRADSSVVEPALETDSPERCVAVRYLDA